MYYFNFNIGDYSSHTSRLPPMQDLAYRRILDIYYLTERPLNGCSTDVAQEIGLFDFEADVAFVLGKYFTLEGGNWVNYRCETEIIAYQNKLKMASRAGKASGKARKLKASEQTFNGRSTDVEPNKGVEPNNKQETRNKKHSSPKYKYSDEDLGMSKMMFKKIQSVAPSAKEPSFESWANDLRMMREIDGIVQADAGKVFEWANSDTFWATNILSTKTFRKQYAQLHAKMSQSMPKESPTRSVEI